MPFLNVFWHTKIDNHIKFIYINISNVHIEPGTNDSMLNMHVIHLDTFLQEDQCIKQLTFDEEDEVYRKTT